MKRALLVLLCCVTMSGEPSLPWIDLSGRWKTIDRDDLSYARPEFDDSNWKTINLPGVDLRQRNRWFWLRRTVSLPPDVPRTGLALTVGKVSENFRVYVNGVLVGSEGDLTIQGTRIARPQTFALPPLANGPVHIAIRAWVHNFRGGTTTWFRYPDSGPYVLTAVGNAPVNAGIAYLSDLKQKRMPDATLSISAGTLALILLLIFLNQRSRHEVLFLALYGFMELVRRGDNYFLLTADSTPWRYQWALGLTVPLMYGFVAEFALKFFRFDARPLRIVLWVCVALQCLSFILDIRYWPRYAVPLLTSALLIWVATRIRTRSGIVTFIALAVVFVSQVATDGLMTVFSFFYVRVGGFETPFHPIGTVVFMLAMVLVLTRRSLADGLEKQRLLTEMAAARTVQQLLVADPPDLAEYHIQAVYHPAQEVGGDFYWTREDGAGGVLVMTGDVSGKGLHAAMLVSVVIGALRRERSNAPGDVLRDLNEALVGQTGGGFVTACCARLAAGGAVTIATAGHPPPYLGGRELSVDAGLPLGVLPDAQYAESSFRLQPGESLTLVSDGVLEATATRGELFGFDRTRSISTTEATEIADAARAWGQNDDITVVQVRRAAA